MLTMAEHEDKNRYGVPTEESPDPQNVQVNIPIKLWKHFEEVAAKKNTEAITEFNRIIRYGNGLDIVLENGVDVIARCSNGDVFLIDLINEVHEKINKRENGSIHPSKV